MYRHICALPCAPISTTISYTLYPAQIETQGDIFSFTDAPPVKKTKKVVTYGPYEAVDTPFPSSGVRVHYINNAPFAAVTQLDRELEISHWGNIYVEERYAMVRLEGTGYRVCALRV